MPSANGHGPRDVGMSGSLVGCLLACLVAWLVDCFVGWLAPNQPKIDQDGFQNPPQITKFGVNILYNRYQEASWRGPGGSREAFWAS